MIRAPEYPAGTIFCCRKCGMELFRTKRDFDTCEIVKCEEVEGLGGFVPVPFGPVVCPSCEHPHGLSEVRPKGWFEKNGDL